MIVTKTCDAITIQSNLIAEATLPNVVSVVVSAQINCCSDKKNTTITGSATSFVIQPSFFGHTTLKDGIYHIELELTYADGTKKKEVKCVFIDCTLLCKLVSFMANNPDSKAYQLYELIKHGEDCGQCDCSDLCMLYKKLIEEVKLKQDKNIDCGCKGS